MAIVNGMVLPRNVDTAAQMDTDSAPLENVLKGLTSTVMEIGAAWGAARYNAAVNYFHLRVVFPHKRVIIQNPPL